MSNKPIPEGYKIFALAEDDYTYAFFFTSRVGGFLGIDIPVPTRINVNPTSRIVFSMCAQLHPLAQLYILYCDNHFSNVSLFEALREFQIAACGTVRLNSTLYPKCLKIKQKRAVLPWGTLGEVAVERVLAVIWQDKTLVWFLTTASDM